MAVMEAQRLEEEQAGDAKRRRLEDSSQSQGLHSNSGLGSSSSQQLSGDSQINPAADPDASMILLNDTDRAWLTLYYTRKDLSSSIMDDIFPLLTLPDPTHFSTARSFFEFVDALPGPRFKVTKLRLPDIPEDFPFAYQPLDEIMRGLLAQHNGKFLDPDEDRRDQEPDFIDGERFRHLQAQLRASAGRNAYLMPVILSSGASKGIAPLVFSH